MWTSSTRADLDLSVLRARYFFDGGSLATLEKSKVTGENGEEVTRECWLARVGEHHNSPAYDGCAGDPTTEF